jgi:hypothetical protein
MAHPSGGADESDILGEVTLYLAETPRRGATGVQIDVGSIRLLRWLIHPIVPLPRGLSGANAYLVKVNYDLRFHAAPVWAEVGFHFAGQGVTVIDGLPSSVTRYEDVRSFELTPALDFALRDGGRAGPWPHDAAAAHIAMPATAPVVEFSGRGGDEVRWRHSSTPTDPVALGSRYGWLTLQVPDDWKALRVSARVAYDLGAQTPQGLHHYMLPDSFLIDLPLRPDDKPLPAETRYARPGVKPRVFVSYAHESPEHQQKVAQLCELLHRHDMDVRVDVEGVHRRDWSIWTNDQIVNSDFTVVVASPAYRDAALGKLASNEHPGVQSEYARIADLFHNDREHWLRKILPVVLPGRSVDEVPLTFLPRIGDHYIVERFTPEGAASLLAVLDTARPKPPTP